MSGTSVDGIDAVALQVSADLRPERLVAHISHAWPPNLQAALKDLPLRPPPAWSDWLSIDANIAVEHAAAVASLLENPALRKLEIAGIGFHGQTIFHAPDSANTLQLGSPAHLAAATGLPVVADFRRADMAAGGQGAPLGPLFHEAVFGAKNATVAVINLGGIANISILKEGRAIAGYDTGPANGLMDGWCTAQFACPYDANGQRARQGRVLPRLLAALLSDPYFQRSHPKSTGREYFSASWLEQHLIGNENPLDVLRTLLELTVRSVAEAAHQQGADNLVVVGGGSANPFLMERLAAELPGVAITSSDTQGWPAQTVEGALIAWLAARCRHGISSDCTRITGASSPTVLGAYYPPPAKKSSAR